LAQRTLPRKKLADAVENTFNVRAYDSDQVTHLFAESEDQQLLSRVKEALIDREHERDRLKAVLDESRHNLTSVSTSFAQQIAEVNTELTSAKSEVDGLLGKLASTTRALQEVSHDRDQLSIALEEAQAAVTRNDTHAASLSQELEAARAAVQAGESAVAESE